MDIIKEYTDNISSLYGKLGINPNTKWEKFNEIAKVVEILENKEENFSKNLTLKERPNRINDAEKCIVEGCEIMGLGVLIWWIVFGSFIDTVYQKFPGDQKRYYKGKTINKKVRGHDFYVVDWFRVLKMMKLLDFEPGKPKDATNARVRFCWTRTKRRPKLNTFTT